MLHSKGGVMTKFVATIVIEARNEMGAVEE